MASTVPTDVRFFEASDDVLGVHAPAKINLFLHIVGRRSDGYHLLESLFAFTCQGDRLWLRRADTLSLQIVGPQSEKMRHDTPSDNIILKAAQSLAAYADIKPNVSVTLEKNLPIAAGIGGGSADAAATLIGLNRLWQLNLSEKELAGIALELGADVPACLSSIPVFVGGIGEKVCPAQLSEKLHVLLVNPGVPLSTPAVFSAYKDMSERFDSPLESNGTYFDLDVLTDAVGNSLEQAAKALNPDIERLIAFLDAIPDVLLARMSGSGATCFAVFDSAEGAKNAGKLVRKTFPSYWTMVDEIRH